MFRVGLKNRVGGQQEPHIYLFKPYGDMNQLWAWLDNDLKAN